MQSAAVGNIGGAERSSGTRAANAGGAGGASDRNIDKTSGELSQALTGGGKANFQSPGEKQNFDNGLRDAVRDMSKGAERASSEGKSPMQDKQFQDGLKQLVQMLGQLLAQKGEGKEAGQGGGKPEGAQGGGQGGGKPEGAPGGGKGGGKPEGAQGAQGAGGAEQSGGGEDDMIKKLVAMLKKMGMGDKEIAALLGQLGVPADSANKAIQAAGQADGGSAGGTEAGADKGSKMGAGMGMGMDQRG